jgi:hypothetical protein
MTKSDEGTSGDLATDLAALRQDVAPLAAAAAQTRVCTASGEIQASIERNSLMAVVIAFGIGLSLGLLSRPRG